MGRAFTHVAYADLAVGNVVNNSFNAGIFGTTHPISLEGLREPTAQYIIVLKSDDVSSDAVRGYASCHAVALLSFLFAPDGARRSVVALSETAIRTKSFWLVHHLAYSSPPQPFRGLWFTVQWSRSARKRP